MVTDGSRAAQQAVRDKSLAEKAHLGISELQMITAGNKEQENP